MPHRLIHFKGELAVTSATNFVDLKQRENAVRCALGINGSN